MSARILLLDIETAPTLAYVWSAWQTNIIDIEQDWYILSFAGKWLDQDKIFCHSLEECTGDELIERLWNLFDEADIIVGHNGDQFDIKKSNAMFLRKGYKPPRPYKTVDTKKIAKKNFKFDKNTLNDLARILGVGEKVKHAGFDLWLGCMNDDSTSWATMREYNIQDVRLLEGIYNVLRPWHSAHPDLRLWEDEDTQSCPSCGNHNIQRRGFSYAKVQIRQRYNCQDCGAWWSGKVVKKSIL